MRKEYWGALSLSPPTRGRGAEKKGEGGEQNRGERSQAGVERNGGIIQ